MFPTLTQVNPATIAALSGQSALQSLSLICYHPPREIAAFEDFAALASLEDLSITVDHPKIIKRSASVPLWHSKEDFQLWTHQKSPTKLAPQFGVLGKSSGALRMRPVLPTYRFSISEKMSGLHRLKDLDLCISQHAKYGGGLEHLPALQTLTLRGGIGDGSAALVSPSLTGLSIVVRPPSLTSALHVCLQLAHHAAGHACCGCAHPARCSCLLTTCNSGASSDGLHGVLAGPVRTP